MRLRQSSPPRLRGEPLEDRTVPGFLAPVSYAVALAPAAVATGDFNSDGTIDLVTANRGDSVNTGSVSVLLGRGDGSFRPAQSASLGGFVPWWADAVAAADFNADGKLDLAVGTQRLNYTFPPNYGFYEVAPTVLLGNGDGTFQPGRQVAAVDTVAYQRDVTFTVYSVRTSVAVGDFNRDGTVDLVVTSGQALHDVYEGDSASWDHVTVLVGHGDGTFAPGSQLTVNDGHIPHGGVRLAVGDVNGDGGPDLATSVGDVLLNNGNGTFGVIPTGAADRDVSLADFNADGRLDLVLVGPSLRVLLGNGDGTFQVPTYSPVPAAVSAAVGDVNRDGNLDLVTANEVGNTVSVLLGGGDGRFQPPVPAAVGSAPVALVAGDFNRDGWIDAATANTSTNTAAVLINDGSWAPQGPPTIAISDVRMREGRRGATAFVFTVSLSAPAALPVTVRFATTDGTATAADGDYQAAAGTLTFAPGETSKTITVWVIGDKRKEADETFTVGLTGATNASIVDGVGLGTIVNDD